MSILGRQISSLAGLKFLKDPLNLASKSFPIPGNITVVELWATWCPPCRASIPHLTELQHKYKDKGVVILGVTQEKESPQLKAFVQQMGSQMDYSVALDADGSVDDELSGPGQVQGIPHAFILDHACRVQYSGHPSDPNFERKLLECIKNRPIPKPSPIKATRQELAAMPVRELKKILDDRHIRYVDLHEKPELVDRILEQCT